MDELGEKSRKLNHCERDEMAIKQLLGLVQGKAD